eukprot:6491889-Amphidinium_carterae.1
MIIKLPDWCFVYRSGELLGRVGGSCHSQTQEVRDAFPTIRKDIITHYVEDPLRLLHDHVGDTCIESKQKSLPYVLYFGSPLVAYGTAFFHSWGMGFVFTKGVFLQKACLYKCVCVCATSGSIAAVVSGLLSPSLHPSPLSESRHPIEMLSLSLCARRDAKLDCVEAGRVIVQNRLDEGAWNPSHPRRPKCGSPRLGSREPESGNRKTKKKKKKKQKRCASLRSLPEFPKEDK